MTAAQQQQALELLREAVHKSLDADFDRRVNRLFSEIVNTGIIVVTDSETLPGPVPIFVKNLRTVCDSPLNDYHGGPA